MNRYLIATHGYMADGVRSSLDILVGSPGHFSCINAYVDESDYTDQIQTFIESVHQEDTAVIFTDFAGGSVNQRIMEHHPEKKGIFVIAGFNLSLVIDVILAGETLTLEKIQEMIANSASQIKCLPEVMETQECSKLDDFFND